MIKTESEAHIFVQLAPIFWNFC